MFKRIVSLGKERSFFLFGARGTGKSTLLEHYFSPEDVYWIDLLDPKLEEQFFLYPETLIQVAEDIGSKKWIVIDEVQKAPKLLDVVHQLIQKKKLKFALTGSSARKLKRGSANLLAGRAFMFNLFPLTHRELDQTFNLHETLRWGSLPEIFQLSHMGRLRYLRAYATTYLKEEILQEQLIRKIRPFRAFLEVAAQSSGTILNYSKIARDIHSDPVTVQSYFQILIDTLLGFYVEPFHQSIRKRQRKAPKFYFFDLGVLHSLEKTLQVGDDYSHSFLGRDFEHFVILEIYRLIHYLEKDWTMTYLCTKDNAEIDLLIERPGMSHVAIEIKSSDHIEKVDLSNFIHLSKDLVKNTQCYVFSRDKIRKRLEHVHCLFWKEGIETIGL